MEGVHCESCIWSQVHAPALPLGSCAAFSRASRVSVFSVKCLAQHLAYSKSQINGSSNIPGTLLGRGNSSMDPPALALLSPFSASLHEQSSFPAWFLCLFSTSLPLYLFKPLLSAFDTIDSSTFLWVPRTPHALGVSFYVPVTTSVTSAASFLTCSTSSSVLGPLSTLKEGDLSLAPGLQQQLGTKVP